MKQIVTILHRLFLPSKLRWVVINYLAVFPTHQRKSWHAIVNHLYLNTSWYLVRQRNIISWLLVVVSNADIVFCWLNIWIIYPVFMILMSPKKKTSSFFSVYHDSIQEISVPNMLSSIPILSSLNLVCEDTPQVIRPFGWRLSPISVGFLPPSPFNESFCPSIVSSSRYVAYPTPF